MRTGRVRNPQKQRESKRDKNMQIKRMEELGFVRKDKERERNYKRGSKDRGVRKREKEERE